MRDTVLLVFSLERANHASHPVPRFDRQQRSEMLGHVRREVEPGTLRRKLRAVSLDVALNLTGEDAL